MIFGKILSLMHLKGGSKRSLPSFVWKLEKSQKFFRKFHFLFTIANL